MTKPDASDFANVLANVKPIPGFHPRKWLREVRAQIYEETKNMTFEEQREHTRQASEKLRKESERHRTQQTKKTETGGTDN